MDISDAKLSGDAYDDAVRKAMDENMGGASDCATGGGKVVFGKYQTGDNVQDMGAGPSKANQTVRMDGSAPGLMKDPEGSAVAVGAN